ncbi:GrpB family protein [Streptomyces axinellae]|uniref:GrpB family protein n=1 Tax=Streptomyces axinellae TaxID=552788 RepID=A0ABN3Q5S8_9ACTN
MPFPDERQQAEVIDYQPQWPTEFARLAGQLSEALDGRSAAIDHVGSTSVAGLPAKDCIDVQIRVESLDEVKDVTLLAALGFRCRPEPWNRSEVSAGVHCRKLVFAPPAGARPCNVHLRESDGQNARYALLFRDFLRADELSRRAWGTFKRRLATSVPDLMAYGQIKAPATDILMAAAESWAADSGWSAV